MKYNITIDILRFRNEVHIIKITGPTFYELACTFGTEIAEKFVDSPTGARAFVRDDGTLTVWGGSRFGTEIAEGDIITDARYFDYTVAAIRRSKNRLYKIITGMECADIEKVKI